MESISPDNGNFVLGTIGLLCVDGAAAKPVDLPRGASRREAWLQESLEPVLLRFAYGTDLRGLVPGTEITANFAAPHR